MSNRADGRVLDGARSIAMLLVAAERSFKRLLVGIVDAASCAVAVWLSFSIRLGYWELATRPVLLLIGFEIVLSLALFGAIGAYRNVFRFHGPRGLAQLASACALVAVPTIVIFGFISVPGVPRTISVLFPILFFALVATSRIMARTLLIELLGPGHQTERVLIYGAGVAGRQLALSLGLDPSYRLVGYIDDDAGLSGIRIENLPVDPSSELERIVERREVDIVLLAIPELGRSARASIVKRLQHHDVRVQTLPPVRDLVDGKVSIKDLREIEITELLSRDAVAPDPVLLTRVILDRVVMVTGAGGSIGSELCRQILDRSPRRLIMAEMTEAALFAIDEELRRLREDRGVEVDLVPELVNLENGPATRRLFERFRPEVIFHAAAYKHVPLLERNAVSGVRNNVRATRNAALAARDTGVARFILVSSDKAVRPTNVMGASKRVCELVLQGLAGELGETIYSMVRFGNVLGSSGSVVPHFERQIARGGPVTVTHRDVTRFFMTIPEAAELVIQAGAMARGGEVYLLDMGEPVRIYDLARAMVGLAGLTVKGPDNPDGDIVIEEIGLRPGEKLYEELLISAEARPTNHERIMMADEDRIGWAALEPMLDRLDALLDEANAPGVRAMLSELVAGYGAPSSRGEESAAITTGEAVIADRMPAQGSQP